MTALPTADAAADLIGSDALALDTLRPTADDSLLSRSRLTVFSAPALPIAALGLPLVVALPEFYANYVGVKLAAVGLIFMLVRLADLSLDPIIGAMMDATKSRFGRFRPWMAVGAPILMLATYMVFMAHRGAGAAYLFGWLLLLYVGYSVLVLGQAAWGATLAPSYNQRSRVYAWLQTGAIVGMMLVLSLLPIAALVMKGDPAAGLHAMGWFVIILTPLTVGLLIMRMPEGVGGERGRAGGSLDVFRRFFTLAKRPAVARILLADLCLAMAPGITGAVFIFFFREARGFTTVQANLLLLTYFIGALAGAPVLTRLAKRFGKHRALVAASIWYAVLQSMTLLSPRGSVPLGMITIFLAGLAYSAPTIMLRSMLADAADEARVVTDVDDTGLLYAMITSTQKVASAVSVGLSFYILSKVGFVPKAGAPNTAGAIQGLEMLFVIAPVVFLCVACLALWGYRLDEARHRAIRAELERRDSARSPA